MLYAMSVRMEKKLMDSLLTLAYELLASNTKSQILAILQERGMPYTAAATTFRSARAKMYQKENFKFTLEEEDAIRRGHFGLASILVMRRMPVLNEYIVNHIIDCKFERS